VKKQKIAEAALRLSFVLAAGVHAPALLAQTTDSDSDKNQDQQTKPTAAATSSSGDIEEIVVTGIRASLEKSVDIKRESMNIVDAIVAEDIGKFPDNNVVEALQRITGVQVTDRGSGEANTVTIRGLTDVTTTVNGRNIFTASGRSVALADIPAALLARADVFKTRSADQIETGIAGQIDIRTQRPFNFDGAKAVISARGIYEEQRDKVDPTLAALVTNTWDLSNGGRFGALVNVSYAETNYRDQSVTPGAVVPFFNDAPPEGFSPFQRIGATVDDPTTADVESIYMWTPGLPEGLPNAAGSTMTYKGEDYGYLLSRDAIFASDFTGKRKRPAANISLQWAPNDTSEYLFEAFYNGYRNQSFNSLLFSFVDGWWGLGAEPSSIEVYDGTNVIKSRQLSDMYGFSSGDLSTGKTNSYVYALGGNWDLTDDLHLKSEAVYQQSKYTTDFFAMRGERVAHQLNVDFNDHGGLPSWQYVDNPDTPDVDESNMADSSQWTMAQLYDSGTFAKGNAFTLTADGDYTTSLSFFSKIKFGARYDDRHASEGSRTADAGICPSANDGCAFADYAGIDSINHGFFDGRADVPTTWFVPNGYYIRKHADQFRQLYNDQAGASFALSDDITVPKNFQVDEATTAAYAMSEFATEFGTHKFDGQVGVRFVNVKTDMDFYDYTTEPTTKGTASKSTSKLLPSLMLRYEIVPNVISRFAYGQTLRRPNFGDLNPNITYVKDVTNIGYGTASGGNPDLKPTESKNYDFSLEWYFARSSSLYGTLFRRDIDGLVVSYNKRVTYDDGDGEYPYILTQPDNASDGKLQGMELGLIYFPENLPGLLNGLGIQASFTGLDSSQTNPVTNDEGEVTGYDKSDMFGVSDKSYTATLAYQRTKYDARLSYTWRDDFLNNNEAAQFANPLGVYRKAEESLDFQLSYFATDNLTITADATNLTNEIFQSYYENPKLYNFGNSLYSRTFAVGLRYQF